MFDIISKFMFILIANMLKIVPNEECQRIEVLLEKDYFDITTEENFNKIKDNIRYLQRIKVSQCVLMRLFN